MQDLTIPNMLNYEQERAQFSLPLPTHFNFVQDIIDTHAISNPEKLAMLWISGDGSEQRRLTFGYFSTRSSASALAFTRMGIHKGDRVLVMLPRVPEWWEVVLGLIRFGAVPIPCTTLLTSKDLEFRSQMSEAVAIITDAEGVNKFDTVRSRCLTIRQAIVVGNNTSSNGNWTTYSSLLAKATPPYPPHQKPKSTDPMMIYFTSGTSGMPKMVLHSHGMSLGHTITGRYWLDLKPNDLHWNLSESGWAKWAWSNLFGPWIQCAAIFIHDSRGKFSPIEVLANLHKYPITTLCAPPTAYRMLCTKEPLEYLVKYSPNALRHCVGAGEPLNPEVIRVWEKATGMVIRDGYGQTETVLLVGNFPCDKVKPGSMGRPCPGFTIAVIDDKGNELPTGKEGDIGVLIAGTRPPWIFDGYFGRSDLTAKTVRADKWYITGDRAYRDEDGYLFFVGRGDDVVTSAGYRIGPFEVESALREHPAVVEAAVVASPDPVRGDVVKAFVVVTEEYHGRAFGSEKEVKDLIAELQGHVRTVTSPYKYPREVEFVEMLPKTISGKIRRVELRELEKKKKQGLIDKGSEGKSKL